MREHILSEIKRLAAANGGSPPGRRTFENETGIRYAEWYGVLWARWGDALAEAGFAPNTKTDKFDTDQLLAGVAEVYRHYGRVTTDGELRLYRRSHPELPAHSTISAQYPSKPQLMAAVKEWALRTPGNSDIAAMIPEVAGTPRARPRLSAKRPDGSVYLIQSGPNYKIGRSDELERRVKEIRVALPDAATLIHVIATDDPPGIEAYWHRRFADRRANGEWFKLAPADVAAFKRRRFQ
jgi:hypothetical protein